MKHAAKNEAEADYIRRVKEAEADRDRKILQGEGISGQRLAILKGYEQGVDDMVKATGLTSREIVKFVLETQRFDMLENIGSSSNAKTVFLNHQAESLGGQLRDATLQANEVSDRH